MFGCIQGGIKYDCSGCDLFDNCTYLNDSGKSQTTGGICKDCWEKRRQMKDDRIPSQVY
jgi:hypothetical protein